MYPYGETIMKWKNLLLVLALSLPLTGCFTLTTLYASKDGGGIIENKGERIDSDYLVSFGVLQSTGQAVLIGEKYWFVADDRSSKEIKGLMEARVKGMNKFKMEVYNVQIFLDKKRQNGKLKFGMLYNDIGTKAEQAELKKLGFKGVSCSPKNQCSYHQRNNYHWNFKVYGVTPQTPQLSDKFPTPIYLTLEETQYGFGGSAPKLLLPLAIAGDIITLPVQGLMLLGVAAGGNF